MAYLSQQKGVTDMFGKITLPTAKDGFTDNTGKVRIDGMYVFVMTRAELLKMLL